MRILGSVFLALLLAAALPAAAGPCDAPPELLDSDAPLQVTAEAVRAGRLRILVVGSASVLGPGSSGPAAAWPARLEARLAALRPGLVVEVAVRGGRGLTAADMLTLLDAAANPPPHLVVWQAGTVEAARGVDTEWLASRLDAGLTKLRERGIDAVLVDPQFSRFMRANADIEPYRGVLRIAAGTHGVPLFNRYELMRHWADNESIDLERTPREGRMAAVDLLGACLGQTLATFILDAVADALVLRP
jgi:hypothetical protein